MFPSLHYSLRAVAGLALAATLVSLPGKAATTVGGPPSGVIAAELGPGIHPLSFPLIRSEVFSGIVSSNTATTITFAAGDIPAALISGEQYYLEVVTGPMEGDRFDLGSASGSVATLNLTATSHSTVSSVTPGSLGGARVVIRQHVMLKHVAAMFSPALVGHTSAALADNLHIYKNGGLSTYYLRGDGLSWREPGKASDQRNYVIPPDASVLLNLKSGAKQWLHTGGVRANAFRVNLVAGTRAFATGFPVDLSFADISAFVDEQQPPSVRWVGGNSPGTGDRFQIYSPSLNSFENYYLHTDGTSWRAAGGTNNVAEEKLLTGRGMFLLKRANADADYFVLLPYVP